MNSHLSRRAVLSLVGSSIGLVGCSGAGLLNAVSPAEPGAGQVARDLAFGPHPRQRLDIYAPASSGSGRRVVLFIYGGAWNTGSKADYAFVGHAFAARGFVTVIADYRLVPEVRFPDFVDDGARALAWIHDRIGRYGGDRNRIDVAGHSAGAYNAAMLALDPRFLARAGLGPGTIKAVAGLSGPYDFLPLDQPASVAAFGMARDLAATQPVSFARRAAPPMLLVTGSADTTVYPRNTEALAVRLRRAGAVVSVRIYPGVDHAGTVVALAAPFRGRAPVLADVTGFFERFG